MILKEVHNGFFFIIVVMTCKCNTKFSCSDIFGQKKPKIKYLALAMVLNLILGGK